MGAIRSFRETIPPTRDKFYEYMKDHGRTNDDYA